MSAERDYYEVLGLSPDSAPADIRLAYRRLVKRVHPDTSVADDATRAFRDLHDAYETLSDPDRRTAYDVEHAAQLAARPRSAFALELQSSHTVLPPLAEAQMLYVLADVRAASHVVFHRPALNLCIAIDHSLSMDGSRLQRAQEAAEFLINKLGPGDIVSIVAFSDRARVMLSGHGDQDRSAALGTVRAIVPWGGTELLQGIASSLTELRRWRSAGTVDHLFLITDGQTYGDETGCLEMAEVAGRQKIGLTLLGLGSDWNDVLLDEMAARSGGYAAYVDSPSRLLSVFDERLRILSAVIARDVRLAINLEEVAQISGAFRLTPDIARLPLTDDQLLLGTLEANSPTRVLLEVLLTLPQKGRRRVLRASLTGEPLDTALGRRPAEAGLRIEVSDVSGDGRALPEEFDRLLARIAVFKVQEKAMADVERGDRAKATSRLRHLATHLLDLGNAELAGAVMREAGEMDRSGHISADGRLHIRYGTRSMGSPRQADLRAS
jgi:Ca-activated chloride channel family protein